MDFGTLKSTVLDRISMASDDPAAASVGGLINEALHELEAIPAGGWPWMRVQTTVTEAVASSYTFAVLTGLSSEIIKILEIEVLYAGTYYSPMQFMSPAEAHRLYPSTQTGTPEAWYGEAGLVYVFPTPNGAPTFRVRSVISEPDLTDDSDEPLLPPVFHSAIVEAALCLYYELLQDTAKMQATQARVDRWVHKMETYGPQTGTSPRVMIRDSL